MSNRDNFNTGFLLGSLIGGVVGALIGALVTNKANRPEYDPDEIVSEAKEMELGSRKSKRQLRNTDRLEMARRSLDDKIVDLDRAIDAVRSSLGSVADPATANEPSDLPDGNARNPEV